MPKTTNPANAVYSVNSSTHRPSPQPEWSRGVPGVEFHPAHGWCSEWLRQGRGGLPVERIGGVLVSGRCPVRAYWADYQAAQEAAQVRAMMAARSAEASALAALPQGGYGAEVMGPDWRAYLIEAANKARKLGRGAVRIATGISKSMTD